MDLTQIKPENEIELQILDELKEAQIWGVQLSNISDELKDSDTGDYPFTEHDLHTFLFKYEISKL